MIAFIVNPISGNGRGASAWRVIEAVLQERAISYHVLFTQSPGDARTQAAQLLKMGVAAKVGDAGVVGGVGGLGAGVAGADKAVMDTAKILHVIVAVGGDGTVNEVINAFYEAQPAAQPCAFGHIPTGTGNDYARGHGIPLSPLSALELLLQQSDKHTLIDLLLIGGSNGVGGKVAVNSIGCGMDGQIAKTTNQASYKQLLNRLYLGKLAYVISLFRVLFTYRPTEMTLYIDGQEIHHSHVWFAAIANIRFYGGGMMICPDAAPADGTAEICVVSKISRWVLPFFFPLVYSGKHIHHPAVTIYTGKVIEIKSSSKLVSHTDGELFEDSMPSIRVLPSLLSVVDYRGGTEL